MFVEIWILSLKTPKEFFKKLDLFFTEKDFEIQL